MRAISYTLMLIGGPAAIGGCLAAPVRHEVRVEQVEPDTATSLAESVLSLERLASERGGALAGQFHTLEAEMKLLEEAMETKLHKLEMELKNNEAKENDLRKKIQDETFRTLPGQKFLEEKLDNLIKSDPGPQFNEKELDLLMSSGPGLKNKEVLDVLSFKQN